MATAPPRDDDRLDLQAAAVLLGFTYGTARTMRSQGDFPEQDGKVGGSPWWFRFKLEAWKQARTERIA